MSDKAADAHCVLIKNEDEISILGGFSDKDCYDFIRALLMERPDLQRFVTVREANDQ